MLQSEMTPICESLTLLAPAKINLSLEIVGRKENGYHLLHMVMQSIGLYDRLTLRFEQESPFEILLSCDQPDIPTDGRNVVCKAAKAFFNACGRTPNGALHFGLEKHIPSQAGMAGGSTDAAAALAGLNRMFGEPFSVEKLRQIGLTVGADVPYCLHGKTAFVSGIGEEITALKTLKNGFVAGARPQTGVSTAAAYAAFDRAHPDAKGGEVSARTKAVLQAVESRDLKTLSGRLFNEFESVCDVEEVNALRERLLRLGALGAVMTGSGSAVYGLFDDEEKARWAYEALKLEQPEAFFAPLLGEQTMIG